MTVNKIFIDTSSLIKRYVLEKGSERIDDYFNGNNQFVVSQITKIEFNSAVKRRCNEKVISENEFKIILKEFNLDFKNFDIVYLDKNIENLCINLILKYQMKTLDSIQLASGIISKSDYFITSDEKLYNRAKKELKVKAVLIK